MSRKPSSMIWIGLGGLLLLVAVLVIRSRSTADPKHGSGNSKNGSSDAKDSASTVDQNNQGPSNRIRVHVQDHDGRAVPGAQVAVVRCPMTKQDPLALGRTDARGDAELDIAPPPNTENVMVIACLYEQAKRILWAERETKLEALRGSTAAPINLQFALESVINGQIFDVSGQPMKNSRVHITFGWAGENPSPDFNLFVKLTKPPYNELVAQTDEAGTFTFSQVPSRVFLGFFESASERAGSRYEVTTNLEPFRKTRSFYIASTPGTYQVTIRRMPMPELRVILHLPNGIAPEETRVAVRLARLEGATPDIAGGHGHASKEGEFRVSIPVGNDFQPESLHGHRLWIALYHPDLGVQFHDGTIDTRTFTEHVTIQGPSEGQALEGIVHDEQGRPVPGLKLTIESALFMNDILQEVTTDQKGYFRIDRLNPMPNSWKGLPELERKDTYAARAESDDEIIQFTKSAGHPNRQELRLGVTNNLEVTITRP